MRRDASIAFSILLLSVPAGCFNPEEGDGSAAATESGTEGSSTATDDDPSAGPSSSAEVTTASASASDSATTQGTDTNSGTDDSTTSPGEESGSSTGMVEPMCGDGVVVPGELCFPEMPELHNVGNGAFDLVIADLNGDDLLDIATLNRASATVSILAGDGVGGFGNPESETVADDPFRMHAADGDLDGDTDLVVAANALTVLVNQNDNYWQRVDLPDSFGTFFNDLHNDMVVLQGNGDPRIDIVASEAYSMVFVPGTVMNMNWSFGSATAIGIPDEGASGMAKTQWDFDGDNFVDLVALNQYENAAYVLTGNGNGTFTQLGMTPPICPMNEGARHAAVGDIDGDGSKDIFVSCMQGSLGYVLGNGDGTFGIATVFDGGASLSAHRPYLVDLDGDQDIDLVVPHFSMGISVYVNDGSGQLSPDLTLAPNIAGLRSVAFGDLNGDGALDIATAFTGMAGGRLAVWLAEP